MQENISPAGTPWSEFRKTLLTPEERAEIDLKVKVIGKLIEARNGQNISQRELAKRSGIKQPVIARIERCKTSPQISTLLKILQPLGYTLDIVPIEQRGL